MLTSAANVLAVRSREPRDKGEPIDWFLTARDRTIREAGKKPVKKGYDITVDLYLGGNIGLAELEVPLEIVVESSGEIEKFVITHDAQRLTPDRKTGHYYRAELPVTSNKP